MATNRNIALCSALAIGESEGAPEWLHLIPAGEIRTVDGRGPYRVPDMAALMAASLRAGEKLVLDENHSTDIAAPQGKSAPARGWIVELQQRADGIWGRIDWTPEGRRMAEAKEYRGVSPVIAHKRDGTVVGLLRASLTNQPNFVGLQALHHQEESMDFRKALLEALSLDGEVDDDAIIAAIKKLSTKPDDAETALQSALAPIARAAGVAEDADAATVLAGVEALKAGDDERLTALQSQLGTVTTELNSVRETMSRKDATAFVDAAITAGRVGVKPQRDRYISMHMKDAAGTEELVNALPILKPGALPRENVQADDGLDDPNMIARHATAYQAKLAQDGIQIDFASAVNAVKEGKHK